MQHHILPIARYTLLEARRNRLLWLALILVAAGLAFTQFLQQVAITESNQIQAALLAAVVRFGAVFMLATFVIFAIYGVFAAAVRNHVITRPKVLTWMRRSFAAAFVGLGIKLALTDR